MIVKSIDIINLRCFENLHLELSPSINVIVGKNNSGKSTIIKALYQLQSSNVFQDIDVRKGAQFSRVGVDLIDCTEEDVNRFNLLQEILVESNLESGRILCLESIFKNKKGRHVERLFVPFNYVEVYRLLDRKRVFWDLDEDREVKYYEYNSITDSEAANNFIYSFLANRSTYSIRNSTTKEDIERSNEVFQYLPAKIQRLANPSNVIQYEKYSSYCEKLLGFKPGIVSVGNNQLTIGCYSDHIEFIPLSAMGDGVANILGLIAVLLTENNKLLLIEEIEKDIHPEALKWLLELIISKSEDNQIVISTHSHIVLKYLAAHENTKVFFVDNEPYNDNKRFVPTAFVSEVVTAEDRLEKLRYLGYDLFDNDLYEGYLFLEESSAERIIRDVIIPLFYPKLMSKLKTISSDGISDVEPRFYDFRRLFTFVHVGGEVYKNKGWVKVDGDKPGKDVVKRLRAGFKNWDSSHFSTWSESNFEKYYPNEFQHKVEDVLKINDKTSKRMAKKELLIEVMNWVESNPTLAKKAFAESSAEVIEFIGQISDKLR